MQGSIRYTPDVPKMTKPTPPTCHIQQPNCGRIDRNPICLKCGIDEGGRYTTEEARELAIAKATALYWQAEAKNLEAAKAAGKPPKAPEPPEHPKPDEPVKPDSPKKPEKPELVVKSKFGMGWLVVVALLLLGVGSTYGAWQYQANKLANLQAEVIMAKEQAQSALQALAEERSKAPPAAAPAALSGEPAKQ